MQLSQETIKFIEEHAKDDVRKLALQAGKYKEVDMNVAITQIAARQIARNKIPLWYNTRGILYPVHLSMEQCSSQPTAEYKASFLSGDSFIDLTGGLGIDFSFIAANFKNRSYVERNEALCEIAKNNFPLLGLDNVNIYNGDGIEHLKEMDSVDTIFIDPARRDGHGGKIVAISDCEPNICELEELLVSKSKRTIVKLSPMLDMSVALRELNTITEIHIVSVDNECKELLLVLEKDTTVNDIPVICVNISGEKRDVFRFKLNEERYSDTSIADNVEAYLYEPNSSIMKGGAYKVLTNAFGVMKLHINSHLYTSNELVEEFPGRKFKVNSVSGFGKKELKDFLKGMQKANITVRNFPTSVDELRKRTKLKEGGNDYIFATTLRDESKVLIKCEKI